MRLISSRITTGPAPRCNPFAPLGVYRPPTVVAGAGDAIQINAVAVTDANFNDTTPAASAGRNNFLFDRSGSGPDSVSLKTPDSVEIVLDREMSDINVVNSTTETDILNFSVPANTMGTNRILDGRVYLTGIQNLMTDDYRARLYFGGTLVYSSARQFGIATTRRAFAIRFLIFNQGATNDQSGGGYILLEGGPNPDTGIAGNMGNVSLDGTSIIPLDGTIDTTAAATFRISLQMSIASASMEFTRKMAILTLI